MTRMLLLAGLAICLWASSATAQQAGDRGPLFQIDPIVDTAFTTGVLGVAMMGEAFISTGEIEAQVPDDEAELLGIDAWIAQRNSASLRAAQVSDIGVYVAAAWAATDTALAWLGNRQDAGLTYFVIYAQSAATTWFVANIFKMAVRRPRPRAYIELRQVGEVTPATQEALSFYSLHTAMAASLGSTATYIAFARNAPAWERWTILGGTVAATAVVGVGRMLSGAHFTTDVLGGLAAGASVGILVPHLHRVAPVKVAATGLPGGGALSVYGDW